MNEHAAEVASTQEANPVHGSEPVTAETILRALPAPGFPRRQIARWEPAKLLVDVTMLALANAFLLATGYAMSISGMTLLVIFDAVALALLASWRGYAPRLRLDALDDLRMTVASTAVATMTILSIDALLSGAETSSYALFGVWIVPAALITLGRLATNLVVASRRSSSKSALTTVIIGAGRVGRLAATRLIDHPEYGLRPIGFLDAEPMEIRGKPLPLEVFGRSTDLAQIVATQNVDCAVVAFSTDSHEALLGLLDECEELGVRTFIVPRLFERVPSRLRVSHLGGLPLLEMHATNPRSIQFAIKYSVDRVLSLALLALLSPLLAAISIAVGGSLGRPILYRQDRVSLDGRRFQMLKFRTMLLTDDDRQAGQFDPEIAPGGVEGADRRTRIGAFLRAWSLDELPQLINVLRGEMSLVGPRPERPEYVDYFAEHVRRYDGRLRTKAGITGWAQIHRLRGQTSISDRVEWDNYYIENFSLWLDFKILLRTIPEALRGVGE